MHRPSAKLAVEEANCDANINNRRLLQEYRVELMKWRKKQAAVCWMQLNLPDALMEQIIELMKKHSTTLENELEQCRAAGTLNDALWACTDKWEAETDELVDALFLQLNNELARELLDKRRRIETAASGSGSESGKSGRVEIRDVESLKGAEKKIGVNSQRQGLSVEADIGEFWLSFCYCWLDFFPEDWCTRCQERYAKNPYDKEGKLWECMCKDMGSCGPICEQCQLHKQVCSYQVEWKNAKEKRKGKSTSVRDFTNVCEELREDLGEFQEEVKAELVAIREEMEEMRIALDRGIKKTREEVWVTLQDLLAEMSGMFTSLAETVKSEGENNRNQLENHLNLGEEDEVEDEVMGLGDNLIDFMDWTVYSFLDKLYIKLLEMSLKL